MDGKLVLLLEPNVRLRAALEVSLLRMGYEVLIAADETTALTLGRSESPDLALISCESSAPGEDSFEVCRILIREQAVDATVMATRRPTRELVLRAVRAGAFGFLANPVSAEALSQKLDKAYQRARTPQGEGHGFQGIDFGDGPLTPGQKVDVITRQAATVRAMPHAVVKILQAAETDASGAQDLAKAIAFDPSIAAVLLKRARASSYAGSTPATQLDQAVIRLGFRACKELVLGLSVVKLMPRDGRSFGLNRLWYWLHSLACGVLAKLICKQTDVEHGGQAFVAGLLHDIGKVFLDDFLTEEYQHVVRKANVECTSLYDAEVEALERNHAGVGAAITEQWGLPPEMVEAISGHHDHQRFIDAEPHSPSLPGVIHLANQMAKALLVGSGGDYLVRPIPSALWKAYGFDESIDPKFVARFYSELEDACGFLGLDPGGVGPGGTSGSGPGVAAVVDPDGRHSFLLSLMLAGKGYSVETFSNISAISGSGQDPSVCLYCLSDGSEELQGLTELQRSGDGDFPTVYIFPEDTPIAERRGRRMMTVPIDCFELASVITDLPGPELDTEVDGVLEKAGR